VNLKRILCADIGGTNNRFAYVEADQTGRLPIVEAKWFRTGKATSFRHLIRRLMVSGFQLIPGESDIRAIAVASPAERGVYSTPPPDVFSREFLSSKTLGRILAQIPVALVSGEESGLWGRFFRGVGGTEMTGNYQNRGSL